MEQERPLYPKRIVLAFIIATIIFAAGFLLSYALSYSKYQAMAIYQEDIRYDLLEIELEKQILISSCKNFDFDLISSQLDNMGSTLTILEERLGKDDKKVIEQKKIYSMLEIQHFLLIQDYNKKCNYAIPTILFFYSNEKEFLDKGEKIGYILGSFKNKNKDVMIYSFDFNLDSNLMRVLKNKYNVIQPNTIIINEKISIYKLDNISELADAFNKFASL